MNNVVAVKPTLDGLQEFYEDILNSLGLQIDDDSFVDMILGGTNFPVTVDGKRMVMPTRDILSNPDWESKVAFHPLSESTYRGESPVLKKLKALVNFRLTTVISCLITELVELAVDTDYHDKLSPKQSELLTRIPKANKKTLDSYSKVINSISPTGKNKLISIYLKRGGEYKGEKYNRIAVTNFPIREEFVDGLEDITIYGVKMSNKRDFANFISLFDYILPDSGESETYSHGSRSTEAPNFDALMSAYIKVAKKLNKVSKLFKKHLDNYPALHIDVSWANQLNDLAFFTDLIPSLEGNDGELSIDDDKTNEHQVTATNTDTVNRWAAEVNKVVEPIKAPTPQPNAFQAPTPQANTFQAPTPTNDGNGLSWNEVMAKRNQPQPSQQVGYQPPQATPLFYPPQTPPPQPLGPPPGFAGSTVVVGQQQPQQYGGYPPQQQYPQQYQQPQQNTFYNNSGI